MERVCVDAFVQISREAGTDLTRGVVFDEERG